DAPRHRPEEDSRHDPHLPDLRRGEQVRRRQLAQGARAGGPAAQGGAIPRVDARLILAGLLFLSTAHAFDHAPWDAQLKKNVVVLEGGKASQFRYGNVDRGALRAYLASLSRVD